MNAPGEALRVRYIHDPLCGWCYAAAPLLAAARADPALSVTLHGGALWPTPTVLPPQLRVQIREADRRISALTGQPFGKDYHERLLPSDELVLDSRPVLAAVLAARELDPAAELPMLEAIQRANYVQARHVARESTLVEIAGEIGLDPAAFTAAYARAPVVEHVREARALMAATGAGGYPAAFVEVTPGRLRAVAPQESLGRPDEFVERLRAAAPR